MAQNPTTLQEPSMDELLASIREIIEESSAAAEGDGFGNMASQSYASEQGLNGAVASVGQDNSTLSNTVPIQDAMKALAARIGLKKQASARSIEAQAAVAPEQNDHSPSPLPFVPPPTVSVVSSSSSPAASPPPPSVVKLSPFGQMNAVPAGKKVKTLNAGQVAPLRPAPTGNVQPKSMMESNPQRKEQSVKEAAVAGHVPLFPQFHSMPTPPKTQNTSPAPTAPNPAAVVKSAPPPPPASSQPQEQKTIEGGHDLTKNFVAEFEQSAESLLRPYIASWLEAHFHDLFEKILREELQRLLSQNLRR